MNLREFTTFWIQFQTNFSRIIHVYIITFSCIKLVDLFSSLLILLFINSDWETFHELIKFELHKKFNLCKFCCICYVVIYSTFSFLKLYRNNLHSNFKILQIAMLLVQRGNTKFNSASVHSPGLINTFLLCLQPLWEIISTKVVS